MTLSPAAVVGKKGRAMERRLMKGFNIGMVEGIMTEILTADKKPKNIFSKLARAMGKKKKEDWNSRVSRASLRRDQIGSSQTSLRRSQTSIRRRIQYENEKLLSSLNPDDIAEYNPNLRAHTPTTRIAYARFKVNTLKKEKEKQKAAEHKAVTQAKAGEANQKIANEKKQELAIKPQYKTPTPNSSRAPTPSPSSPPPSGPKSPPPTGRPKSPPPSGPKAPPPSGPKSPPPSGPPTAPPRSGPAPGKISVPAAFQQQESAAPPPRIQPPPGKAKIIPPPPSAAPQAPSVKITPVSRPSSPPPAPVSKPPPAPTSKPPQAPTSKPALSKPAPSRSPSPSPSRTTPEPIPEGKSQVTGQVRTGWL